MLDENLPTFYLKPCADGVRHHEAFYLTYHGSEPEATYTFKHLDPANPASKACYASALADAYHPSIVYAEVNLIPEWTQPTLSQDEIRKNGGRAPGPNILIPQSFTIQLYDPDQQVVVSQKLASWGGNPSYTFSMPTESFRMPSTSALDRAQDDPASDLHTPRINFVWKREGKLSKDWTCFMTGKSTDAINKKKNREPDIAVALFSRMQEVTIYQSNFSRVDMEDPKGLELVLLLGIGVIRDVYLSGLKDPFNVRGPTAADPKNSGGLRARKSSGASQPPTSPVAPGPGRSAALAGLYPPLPPRASTHQPTATTSPPAGGQPRPAHPHAASAPPAPHPLTAHQLAVQESQLRAEQDAARREDARAAAERRRRDEAEAKRIRKMVEAEEREAEKERRRRQKAVDQETARLKREFGDQAAMFAGPPGAYPTDAYGRPPAAPSRPGRRQSGPYLAPGGAATSSNFFLAPAGSAVRPGSSSGGLRPPQQAPKKSSFWSLRGGDDRDEAKLMKKRSSIF